MSVEEPYSMGHGNTSCMVGCKVETLLFLSNAGGRINFLLVLPHRMLTGAKMMVSPPQGIGYRGKQSAPMTVPLFGGMEHINVLIVSRRVAGNNSQIC